MIVGAIVWVGRMKVMVWWGHWCFQHNFRKNSLSSVWGTLLVIPHYQINHIIATMWWHAGVDKCLMTVTWDCKSDREPPVLRKICALVYWYSDLMYTFKVRCHKTNRTGTLWHEPLKSSECFNIESLNIISSTLVTHIIYVFITLFMITKYEKKIL